MGAGWLLSGCSTTANSALALSATSFNFGQVVVPETVTSGVVTITNGSSNAETLTASLTGDSSLKLVPGLSCGSSLAAGGVCSMVVSFSPTTSGAVSGALSITTSGTGAGTGSTQQTLSITGTGVQLSGGQSLVTATVNPVVARYTWQPPAQGTVSVEFGTTTSYGLTTSSVATPSGGGPVSILVAGMKQNTAYHMRAVLTESDGTVVDDSDQTFTTTSFPADIQPQVTATTAPGMTPQPGVELMDASASVKPGQPYLSAYAVDLQGNLIWGYEIPDAPSAYTIIQPIKMLPNGNFIMVLSFPSQYVLSGQGATLTPGDESVDMIREIDLAGDPVAQVTLASINAQLAADGYNLVLTDLHHDVTVLPNGHMIVIANTVQSESNVTGESSPVNVLGDVLIDLDSNFNVNWVWSEFDHLDLNRHPIGFPDWTHTNAVVYSPSDGDLLVSSRHQSWIFKIDYENGTGSGDILWELGNGGSFTLSGGTAPEDWFYGQHDPSFVGSATSGQFSLTMMDNGYGRIMANGSQCTSSGAACYTTVPVISINEATKTAAITYRVTVPASQFNIWGGNAEVLANGDLEYDLCSQTNGSQIDEVKMTTPAQPVWTLNETGVNLYRAKRIPSLYPGIIW